MLLQLAALDEGLGTGVYGVLPGDVPELKALVGIPDDVHFTCVVTIGKRPPEVDESPLVSRLSQARLRLDELVSWECFTS
jgi:nitroreductase